MMENSKREQGKKAFLLDKFDMVSFPIVNALSIPSFSCVHAGFGEGNKIVGGYMATKEISVQAAADLSTRLMNKEKIDDMDYYEKYLLNATKEERDCYIKEHPDFMNEYPVSYEHRELLQDKIYRGLMRKIRDYEKSKQKRRC